MPDFKDAIEWPNGEGFTPCTPEYAAIIDEMDAILPRDIMIGGILLTSERKNLDDLSPEDYQRWNVLEDKRAEMQMSGLHLGKSVRYALEK
jgi:hypothetical protein